MDNSVSYTTLHTRRSRQVLQYIQTAKDLNSSFHKYVGYLLGMNMNLSITSNHQLLMKLPEVAPDEEKNKKAREKELVKGKFFLKPVYKRLLLKMQSEANELVDAVDLTKHERVYLIMFMGMTAQAMEGKLYPSQVNEYLNLKKRK